MCFSPTNSAIYEAERQRLLIIGHALLFFHIWDSAHDGATADSPIQKSRRPPSEARIHNACNDKFWHSWKTVLENRSTFPLWCLIRWSPTS